jgi:hypothetical protein
MPSRAHQQREIPSTATAGNGSSERPCWNADRRELTFRGRVVKRFRQPADNQETILAAFEEEGWPEAIDDPLPGAPGIEAQDRLHGAVRGLNRAQKEAALVFERDGTGTRVLWRPVE